MDVATSVEVLTRDGDKTINVQHRPMRSTNLCHKEYARHLAKSTNDSMFLRYVPYKSNIIVDETPVS